MIYGGIIIALILMTVMVYMAIGKKSDKKIRIASVIALGFMFLTVIICVIFIFSDTAVVIDPSTFIVGEEPEPKETGGNTFVVIFLVLFLAAIFLITAVLAMKENRKHLSDKKSSVKPISNW